MKKIENKLAKSLLFSGIKEKEIESILKQQKHFLHSYQKNEIINFQNRMKNDVIFLLKGKLKGELISPYGKVIRLNDIEAPQILGPFFIFDRHPAFPLTLTVIKEVTALFLSKKSFLKLLQTHELLFQNFFHILAGRFNYLLERIDFLNFNKINQKIAYYLLNHCQENSNMVYLDLSIKDLADFFGVERPSLSKVIGDLVREGLLKQHSRRIIEILNKEKLISLLND
ncbi:MAG: Crp/Fnr family transcriptional regulator [Spirochaetes bacterium]|nr:Crp/Fnr family transcriptional regulator [Spirochaetota bacterium]